MQQVNIDDLERLERAATQGEWTHRKMDGIWCDKWIATGTSDEDARYIVAMRIALPDLLKELRTYRAADKMLREMDIADQHRPKTAGESAKQFAGGWTVASKHWRASKNRITDFIDKELGNV